MLRLDKFTKSFDNDLIALNNVSFEIKEGEFVVILGPSGSGKTTLLRSINGLEQIDSGTFYFKDREISDQGELSELSKHFGMIFQHYNLIENLFVINNVLTGALKETNHFLSLLYLFPIELKLRALECLKRVQLTDKAYSITGDLSGGQKQRVGIARAIMQNPTIILADEPISNLDPMIAYNILGILKDICVNDGIPVICNLHQVDFALQFADRIICLVDGQISLDEQASELTSDIIYETYKGIVPSNG